MYTENIYRLRTYNNYKIASDYLINEFNKDENVKKIKIIGSISKPKISLINVQYLIKINKKCDLW